VKVAGWTSIDLLGLFFWSRDESFSSRVLTARPREGDFPEFFFSPSVEFLSHSCFYPLVIIIIFLRRQIWKNLLPKFPKRSLVSPLHKQITNLETAPPPCVCTRSVYSRQNGAYTSMQSIRTHTHAHTHTHT